MQRLFGVIWSLGILFLGWMLGLVWFALEMSRYPSQCTIPTEAIIVLTGGSNRIGEALDLLQKKQSSKLLISGVQKGVSLNTILKTTGYDKTVDPKQVFLDYQARSTIENSQRAAQWIKQNSISSVCLVTANYHMRRALLEFHQRLQGVQIIPHTVNPIDPSGNPWFKDTKTFLLYMMEYHKYLGALIRYGVRNLYLELNKE